jgi:hypothetical protein
LNLSGWLVLVTSLDFNLEDAGTEEESLQFVRHRPGVTLTIRADRAGS